MTRFAVLDVATTGRSAPLGDRIVEIAAIVLDEHFRLVRFFESLVQPLRRIPAEAARTHGLGDAEVRLAPAFFEIFPDLMECLTGVTHLVAHDVSFGLEFLATEMTACGHQWPSESARICTMQLAQSQCVTEDPSLKSVAQAMGIEFPGKYHRAAVAAGVTARLLPLLLRSAPIIGPTTVIIWPDAGPPKHLSRCRETDSSRIMSLSEFRLSLE